MQGDDGRKSRRNPPHEGNPNHPPMSSPGNNPETRRRVPSRESLGRYSLRGVLAQGGMGRLYLAEQRGIEGFTKIVALKSILPHLADSPHFRNMFLNEARIAARLEHPNIVATYELGDVDGTYFISMEYLPGEDLGAIFARCAEGRTMPVEIAAGLAQQSANGLHYAHEIRDPSGRPLGLVHRDVNPSNIIVTYYGMVKLLDFGIVKHPASSTQTVPGVFKGKYAYCAPEQIEGNPLDRTTDVFCLGIVLWECLTGRRLFEAATDALTMDAVRRSAIQRPSAYRPEVPRELDEICLRALSRVRSQRFSSAHEFSEALERFLLRRDERPTSKGIGQWLETMFSPERAALKKALAQGSEVEATLARLASLGDEPRSTTGTGGGSVRSRSVARPRALWATGTQPGPAGGGRSTSRFVNPRGAAASAGALPVPVRETPGSARDAASRPPWIIETDGDPPAEAHDPAGAPRSRTTSTEVPLFNPPLDPELGGSLAAPPVGAGTAAPPRRAGKGLGLLIGAGVCVLLAVVIVGLLPKFTASGGRSVEPAVAEATTGGIEVRSDPAGADVFLDGDPMGLVTPTTLTGLRAGRVVEVRLTKAGYAPATRKLNVLPGAAQVENVKLVETAGRVSFTGVPPKATVYVDNETVTLEPGVPLLIPLGEHDLRVEMQGAIMWSRKVVVNAGDQTVAVRPGGSRP